MDTRTIHVGVALPDAAPRTGAVQALRAAGFSVTAAPTLGGLSLAACDEELEVIVDDERLLPVGGIAETSVVVLAEHATIAGLMAAYQRGALGYLGYDVEEERLRAAVEDVANGISVAPPTLTAMLIGSVFEQRPGRDGRPTATPRQSQITVLLEEGLSTSEIAHLLGISPVTVRRHRSELVARRRRQEESYPLVAAVEEAQAC